MTWYASYYLKKSGNKTATPNTLHVEEQPSQEKSWDLLFLLVVGVKETLRTAQNILH